MKDSGSIKVNTKGRDGKKWFCGNEIKPEKLIGEAFIVVDFERDLIPRIEQVRYDREVKEHHGDDSDISPIRKKWLVSIIYNDKPYKFWTGNQYNKKKLEEAEKNGDLPFFSSIEQTGTGRYASYKFCSATAIGHEMPSDEEVERLINKYEMR